MTLPDYFRQYPEEPTELSVSNAIARLVDGLGHRLYWALHGLRDEDYAFKASDDGKTIRDVVWHILGLVNWVYMHVYGHQMRRPESIAEQGRETLVVLEQMRKHFSAIDDGELVKYRLEERSFWSFINMPLSDALCHTGEIRSLRWTAGNPPEV